MAELPRDHETHETNQSLWLLTVAPTIWAAHFLACYITAAVWCAKYAVPGLGLGPVRTAVLLFTIIALLGIGITGGIGYRRHGYGTYATPHDADTHADRHRFLGFATLLLSGLSAVATIYVAAVAYFIETCF